MLLKNVYGGGGGLLQCHMAGDFDIEEWKLRGCCFNGVFNMKNGVVRHLGGRRREH